MSKEVREESDRITYSEKRTINIGNYENIECFFCYSSNLKHYNFVDKTIEIFHSESMDVEKEKEAFQETAKQVMTRVRKVLNIREERIRKASQSYLEFNGEGKFEDISKY